MNFIDAFLNRTTMYRLTLSSLSVLAGISLLFAFFQWLPFSALQLSLSLIALLVSAYATNALGALFTKASPTPESSFITALILFFVLAPLQSASGALLLMAAAAIAMLSKYVLAINKKHIFNPAALAALVFTVAGTGLTVWWVATPILLPFVATIGFLFVRKIRRFDVLWSFAIMATLVFLVRAMLSSIAPGAAFLQLLESFPLVFFGTVMLTEPQTLPAERIDRLIYGALIGFLFSLAFQFGPITATPEFALIIGNIYGFAVLRMRRRVELQFHSAQQLSQEAYEFSFTSDAQVRFRPGQYMEWTVPHKSDNRGIRRFFTIASAPTDTFVKVGVRIPKESSTFKDTLMDLKRGQIISATGVAGDFTLPKDVQQKLAFIAGGIGITPFISMCRHLASRNMRRDMVLIYAAATPFDFAFNEELDSFKDSIGLTVLYLPTDFTEMSNWKGPSGYVTDAFIKKEIPDFKQRAWYLSGPQAMVQNYKWLVGSLDVSSSRIKTDYFPGF